MWNPFAHLRKESKLASDAAWVTFSNFGGQAFGLAHTIGLVTLLSTEEYGLYRAVLGAIGFTFLFIDVRVDESLVKLFTEYRAHGNDGRAKRMVQVAFGVNFVVSAAVFLIAFFVLPLLVDAWAINASPAHRDLLRRLMRIFAFSTLAGCVQATSLGIIQTFKKFRLYSGLVWLGAILRFAGPVGLAFWGVEAAMWGYVLILAVCSAVMLPIALALLERHLPGVKATPLGEDRRRVISFNFQTWLSLTVKGLTQQAPVLILLRYTVAGVTHFQLACTVVAILQSATLALGKVSFPRLSELWARDDYRAFRRLIGKITLYAGIIAIALGIIMALLAPLGFQAIDALRVLKSRLTDAGAPVPIGPDAAPLVYVMLPGSVVICLTLWLRPASLAMGKPVLSTVFNTLIGAIAVVATWLLARAYGPMGAAWAYSMMWIVGLTAFAVAVLRRIPGETVPTKADA